MWCGGLAHEVQRLNTNSVNAVLFCYNAICR